jgi:hypothetical protein
MPVLTGQSSLQQTVEVGDGQRTAVVDPASDFAADLKVGQILQPPSCRDLLPFRICRAAESGLI